MRPPRFLSTLTADRTSWEALVAARVDAATQGVRASLVIAAGVAIAAGVVAYPILGRTGALGTTWDMKVERQAGPTAEIPA